MALKLGADFHVNPLNEDFADRVLEITDGMGADLFMEATGLPTVVYPGIERVIWEGRTLLSTVVVTARAEAKMPVTGEVLQVRKARIVGAQGHSGHGTFPACDRLHGNWDGHDPDEHQEDQPGGSSREHP